MAITCDNNAFLYFLHFIKPLMNTHVKSLMDYFLLQSKWST